MCYVQRQSWQISSLMSCPGEYKRRLCPGWVSAENIKQLTRWTKSSFLLLSLAALCKFYCFSSLILFAKLTIALLPLYETDNEVSGCQRRRWGSQSFFLLLQVLLPRPCRLLPFVTFPTPPWPPALVERGDLSTWMAWTQKEQSSRQDSRFQIQDSREKMKENPRWWRREGERAGSSSTGSPPPPDPPPPPSQPPSPCQVSYAHRLEQPSVRFERLNFEYFLSWTICLTDMILLPFISIHV